MLPLGIWSTALDSVPTGLRPKIGRAVAREKESDGFAVGRAANIGRIAIRKERTVTTPLVHRMATRHSPAQGVKSHSRILSKS